MEKTLILLLMFATPCFAFDEWTKTDTALQATYTVLHVIDWGQTSHQAKIGWVGTYHENNPILGTYPTEKSVHVYFASTLVAYTIISYALPTPWRKVWQGVGIGIELGAIGNNYNIGFRSLF